MRYLILILISIVLSNCSNQVSNFNDKGLEIDIYNSEMTYEKFKETVIFHTNFTGEVVKSYRIAAEWRRHHARSTAPAHKSGGYRRGCR